MSAEGPREILRIWKEYGMKAFGSFTKTSGFKILLLIAVILILLIPVAMIQHLIEERSSRACGAEQEIMQVWGDEYLVLGPVLQIPLVETETVKIRNDKGEEKIEHRQKEYVFHLSPGDLEVETELETEIKKRGIFSVPLFSGQITMKGTFDTSQIEGRLKPNQTLYPEKAMLAIALSNQRGIRSVDHAGWNGGDLDFLSGSQGFGVSSCRSLGEGGIHSPVALEKGQNDFDISIGIQGGKSLRMVPLGDNSSLRVKADWPAPSFQGSYLPLKSRISEAGFEAEWRVSRLSRNIPAAWTGSDEINSELYSALFGVDFFKPMDHYDMNTRAVKYALLFLVVPFLALFIMESILRREHIHPVQYLLAGIGNVVFYLLLLSVSEHLPFAAAYWISAPAVTLMMLLYSRSLLGTWERSFLMAAVMLLCYAFLYFTLQSEDWALLIGSVGCFAIVAAVMFFTRRLDWYGKKKRPDTGSDVTSSDITSGWEPDVPGIPDPGEAT
jgi:inner membrane protein